MAIEQKINYADFVTPGRQAFDAGQRALSQYGTLADMTGLQLTKDIAIEDRAQEAERLRLAAEQRKMLQGAKDKAKKQSTFQTIASLAGTAGGAYLGALSGVPGGMTAGAQLGGSLGGGFSSLFANQGGLVPNYIPAPTNFYTGGEVPGPTGKFNKSNYEELRRIQELIADQEKAIARAQKPSAGRFFEAAGKGYQMGTDIASGLDMLKGANIKERLNMLLNRGQEQRGGIALNQGFKNIIPDTLEFSTSPSWLSPVEKDPYTNSLGLGMDFTFDNVETKNNSMLSLANNPNIPTNKENIFPNNPWLFKKQPSSPQVLRERNAKDIINFVSQEANTKDIVDFFAQGN